MKKHGALALPAALPAGGPLQFNVSAMSPEGLTTVQMGVDYSKAEIPERAYYADYCDIVKDRLGYTLIFGRLVPGANKLRTKIEIAFPEDMLVRQAWATSREFHKRLERQVAARAAEIELGRVEDTDKVQTFRANNVLMSSFGEESVLDFYYFSPRDLCDATARMRQGNVTLEPIVRVALGTVLVYEFLEKLRALNLDEALQRLNAEN